MTQVILPALLALAMVTGAASAQQRTYYDASGKVVARSATDSQGTVTNDEARGNVISRESTSGSTTTVNGGDEQRRAARPRLFIFELYFRPPMHIRHAGQVGDQRSATRYGWTQ
ncbi:hypothetical protein [Bradyrhizobium lablabi]|uniref:hypothetical protein n=1 Tax=Bradyrhizobium lablabi TaxID=722472 RepID=UPI001BA4EA4F|nr:hypothetical protein [Bradyrhizobium lablabi]MBR0698116.1 hypothetical protein [Bradyrhizobium lablabi]